ncbi:MAG: lipid-A-disaccharide synthase [Ignavibacteria bacterium]|nr:lipid-A-disaccharide synthase [Ignavibacteria bacterium]
MKRIFIVAGDTSGDAHAAKLMSALKVRIPDVEFIGIGGSLMEKEGLQSIVSLHEISVVGFWEVAKRYSFFKQLLKKCEYLIEHSDVECFLPVDYPGFNMRLSVFAKKKNIPVIYYIAPQLWAWGAARAEKLAKCVDKLLVVFPFEVEFFQKFGITTEFVGHPLLDNEIFSRENELHREKRIAFLPGSRTQEIKKHIPVMIQTAELIKKQLPDYHFAIAVSPSIDLTVYTKMIPSNWEIHSNSKALMRTSQVGIVKAGTSTLEAALCMMPFVTMYKTSPLSYHISKHLIKLPFISLVNILANKEVVPEVIQNNANADVLAQLVVELITNQEKQAQMQDEFMKIHALLGSSGASARAAEAIIQTIGIVV